MLIEGRIIKCLEVRTSNSKRDGRVLMSQDFVLEMDSGFGMLHHMMFNVFSQERLERFAIKEGQYVSVSFRIDAHEWEGRWYNTITAYDVRQREEPQIPEEEKNPFGV